MPDDKNAYNQVAKDLDEIFESHKDPVEKKRRKLLTENKKRLIKKKKDLGL